MVKNMQCYQPASHLRQFVTQFWAANGKATIQTPYFHAHFPDGACQLLYVYKGRFTERKTATALEPETLVVIGPQDTLTLYSAYEDFEVFGISCYPYVLRMLTGRSVTEFVNRIFRADFHQNTYYLQNQLKKASLNRDRVEVVTRLSKKMLRPLARDASLLRVIQGLYHMHRFCLTEVSSDANLSSRQFQRRCKDFTGFSPKKLHGIVRLQQTIRNADPNNFTDSALKSGYYDQAHFIHDFKKITEGLTPTAYFKSKEALKWENLSRNVDFLQFD